MRIPLLNRVCGISYPVKLCRRQRVCFRCGLWEDSLLPSNWVQLNLDSPSWICIFVLQNSTFRHLSLTLSSLESLCKNKPPTIRMIYESKKRRVQNPSGGFFTFCKINVYGLECFRCVFHDILSRISLTLLPYG